MNFFTPSGFVYALLLLPIFSSCAQNNRELAAFRKYAETKKTNDSAGSFPTLFVGDGSIINYLKPPGWFGHRPALHRADYYDGRRQ